MKKTFFYKPDADTSRFSFALVFKNQYRFAQPGGGFGGEGGPSGDPGNGNTE